MKNRKVKLYLLSVFAIFVISCGGSMQYGYPIFLANGKKINTEYSTFNFHPKVFTVKTLDGLTLESLKIKSSQTEIIVKDIYVVKSYPQSYPLN